MMITMKGSGFLVLLLIVILNRVAPQDFRLKPSMYERPTGHCL